jgi:hypothetical protein
MNPPSPPWVTSHQSPLQSSPPLGFSAAVGNIVLIAAPIFATAWFSTSGVRSGKIPESKENKNTQPLIFIN